MATNPPFETIEVVKPEDIRQGTVVRLLSDYLTIPAGTLATEETIGTTWTGEFYFTVRWLNLKSGTQARPVSDRSLNLWESDLANFQIVSNEEAASLMALPRPSRRRSMLPAWLKVRSNPNQLRLFEDF